jgi:signal peptidase II
MASTTTKRNIHPIWLVVTVLLVLVADQSLKYWIKTNFAFGEERHIAGNWFILHFTENDGMAFGWKFAGEYGKLILTLFRILAVGGIIYYIIYQLKNGGHKGFLICLALILAGAAGNIIDSVFYGKFFSEINLYKGGWFYGQVVDMLYFPIIESHYPDWFPFYAGEEFIFFRPVFNLADASISLGVIIIFLFQGKFFKKKDKIMEEVKEEVPMPPATDGAINT